MCGLRRLLANADIGTSEAMVDRWALDSTCYFAPNICSSPPLGTNQSSSSGPKFCALLLHTGVSATNKRPAARRIPLALPIGGAPLRVSALPVFHWPLGRELRWSWAWLGTIPTCIFFSSCLQVSRRSCHHLRVHPEIQAETAGYRAESLDLGNPPSSAPKNGPSRFSQLCEGVKDCPPKEQAGRVRDYFGIFGGVREGPRSKRQSLRGRLTPGEIQRLEQRSRTRL